MRRFGGFGKPHCDESGVIAGKLHAAFQCQFGQTQRLCPGFGQPNKLPTQSFFAIASAPANVLDK